MSVPDETSPNPAQESAKDGKTPSADPFAQPKVDQKPEKDDDGDKPEIDWKARSREWESRAKANKAAADKLAEIERAQMTEAEKAAEKLREAEQRTAELTAKAARLELALDFRLSKDDAALLEGVTDPEALQRLAQRLAVKAEESRGPKPDPNQGRQTRGPATTADLFAAAIESQFR